MVMSYMNTSDSNCELHTCLSSNQMGFNIFSKGLQLEALNHGKNQMYLIKIQDDSCSFIKGVQMWRVSGTDSDKRNIQDMGRQKGNKERSRRRVAKRRSALNEIAAGQCG